MSESYLEDEIVLIAEGLDRDTDNVTEWDTTLEMAGESYTNDLSGALSRIAKKVHVYASPKDLQDNIQKHADALVMTIYGGKESRNRMAIVPAVCEAHDIDFMGADTYARVLCQDKFLSKQYAERLGMLTPKYVLIERESDLFLLAALKPPLVVKPNFEGTSIGISSKSLTKDVNDARMKIVEILERLQQPVLVEEFCPGREVSLCVAGSPGRVEHFEAVEDIHKTQDGFFNSHLYCSELKAKYYDQFTHQLITHEISDEIRSIASNVFMRLGKCDYLRIDGKLTAGGFSLIELTPDPYLAKASGFSKSFTLAGVSYMEGVRTLVRICRRNLRSPCASAQGSRGSSADR